MAPENCEFCKAPLPDQRGFVFCGSCGAPFFSGEAASPFALFGVKPAFELDASALENRYFELSKRLHPDRFAGATTPLKMHAQKLSAKLNEAYGALRSPESRLESLLRSAGALKPESSARKSADRHEIPMELAEDFFELQEAMMEDGAAASEKIESFRAKIRSMSETLTGRMREAARAMDWSNPSAEKLETILKDRRERAYLESMEENLDRMTEGGL